MASRRVNPNAVKIHWNYTLGELALCLRVHKNTIRNWRAEGLEPIDNGRSVLFHGARVRDFLTERNRRRKRPCSPDTLYCFRCREPRRAAARSLVFHESSGTSVNLAAACEVCGTTMHRRIRQTALLHELPSFDVHVTQAQPRLSERPRPCAICDINRKAPA